MIEPSISGWFRPRPEVGSVQLRAPLFAMVCACVHSCVHLVCLYMCVTHTHTRVTHLSRVLVCRLGAFQ